MLDVAMIFEKTLRLVLGEQANHKADYEDDVKARRNWLTKVIRQFEKDVNTLDTTIWHKDQLMKELVAISDLLKSDYEASWNLVYRVLHFSASLMGYADLQGEKFHTASFWQTKKQYCFSIDAKYIDDTDDPRDQRNVIAVRRNLIQDLKSQGVGTFKIALVLNISENEVKKYLKENFNR